MQTEVGQPRAADLTRHRLALLAAAALWSLGGVFIKKLPVSAFGITLYRSLSAFLCLLPFLRGRKWPRWQDALVAIALYVALLVLYVASVQGTTSANAILLQYTAPLYAMVLGPLFFRETFRRSDLSALIVAMIGIGILLAGSFHGTQRLALLEGLGSGAMFGVFLLWLRHMRYADPIVVTAINNAGVALLATLVVARVTPAELRLLPDALRGAGSPMIAALLVLMGCIQIAVPYALFSYGLQQVPAVEASLLALTEPLLNPVWVAMFAGEVPSRWTLMGGGLILSALVLRYRLFKTD